MPRWPDEIVDSAVFLYHTQKDAEAGKEFGGTGFLIGVPWQGNSDSWHIYAVTNHHVAVGDGASVIRLNTKGGKSDIIELEPHQWFWRYGHDVAVHRIDPVNDVRFRNIFDDTYLFDYKFQLYPEIELTSDVALKYNIGIGDDVFSIGRFIDLGGRQRNEPMVRSGIISMMQVAPITVKGMPWPQEPSLFVEMRSRTGFSGSPVLVYIDRLASRFVDTEIEVDPLKFHGPWLLGVQWGQLPIAGPDANDPKGAAAGMVGVVPCSALTKLLFEDERVVAERREYEERYRESPKVILESALPTTADNPSHKEDFNRLLTSVTTGKPRDDQT